MPSYLSYLNQMSVVDADDDIQWITVRGNHIPIKKGENKEDAIKSFFESKGKESKKTAQKSPEKSDNGSSGSGNEAKSETPIKTENVTLKSILKKAKESKENKSVTVESVIKDAVAEKQYSEKEIRKRQNNYEEYRKNAKKVDGHYVDTVVAHTTGGHWEDGEYVGYEWKPERMELQQKILNEVSFKNILDKLPKDGEKPKLVLLGGRGGSGKSKFTYESEDENELGDDAYDANKFVVIDPDKYKEKLPEYKSLVDKGSKYAGLNAWEVHEESSEMKKMALKSALQIGANVVLDGTMAKYDSVKKTLDKFRANGYIIDVAFMELPREKSAVRGINRGMRKNETTGKPSGRYVPVEVMLGMTDCEENFEKLSKDADHWVLYHNEVPRGKKPQFVAKGGKNGK